METVVHDKIICPMCEKPIRTTDFLGADGRVVGAVCDCPDAKTSRMFSTAAPLSLIHRKVAYDHAFERQQFRNGFDEAMRVLHRFAEQHLPTAADPGVN